MTDIVLMLVFVFVLLFRWALLDIKDSMAKKEYSEQERCIMIIKEHGLNTLVQYHKVFKNDKKWKINLDKNVKVWYHLLKHNRR